MKKSILTLSLAGGLALSAGMAAAEVKVGVTMTSFDNPWLTIVLNGIRKEADTHPDVTLAVEDAQLEVSRQLNQVENFIANGVDAIIVNPVDAAATPPMTKAAVEAGIPLVYVNHPPLDYENLPDGTTFVGSDEKDGARLETEAVCEALGGEGKVLLLMGPLENEATILRTEAVEEVISQEPCTGMEIIEKQSGRWERTMGRDIMTNWLTMGFDFDAVISNNDEMAIGAIQAMNSAGVAKEDVVVAGIDATPDGLAAMEAGDLDVTVFQNGTGQGGEAMKAALSMVNGEEVPTNIWIPFEPVTTENMDQYK
ncbi:sugar ABC transporter substrate-binding protein [Tropicimonas isoalkanivorans]|uniref:Monosaccharide ABC transporter substrate-binding protein, CUT2 family n=1 Tax=Tropicimonas isoalkanivorans TaxID=441112 RepID=A0A1I1HBQ7_9RHOB|nr:sugar ABC transporter substrate-binding protein [Tropicimonas isoalkanivorans]SFC21042.1 monosaccharide ABC transporter substrate-binding protein, CUT2 family [Tropicimonas isoalkanivorans]